MANYTIYLIRHGQTFWNAEDKKKHQTHSNGHGNLLTPEGIKQADVAAEILRSEDIEIAFYTPLTRTKQTLDSILKYHPEVSTFSKNELTEMSMAFLDGMTQDQWESEFPETIPLYADRKNDKFGCELRPGIDYSKCLKKAKMIAEENGELGKVIPTWENYADILERTGPFVRSRYHSGDNTLISGHQGLNRALLGNLLKGTEYIPDVNMIVDLNTPNAAIFKVEIKGNNRKLYHNVGDGWVEGLIEKKK